MDLRPERMFVCITTILYIQNDHGLLNFNEIKLNHIMYLILLFANPNLHNELEPYILLILKSLKYVLYLMTKRCISFICK